MICLIALIIFSILGIFSASKRRLAHEAFDCVWRRITLRPCVTNFNERLRAKIIASLMKKSSRAARFANRYFELLSWIFALLMLASTIWVARGLVNYYLWGNCNGENAVGFCVLDPRGQNSKLTESANNVCSEKPKTAQSLKFSHFKLADYPTQFANSANQIVLVGSYFCDYTRKTYPILKKILQERQANFIFINFPTKEPAGTKLENYALCINQKDPDKFWQFNDALFASSKGQLANPGHIVTVLTRLGLDPRQISDCAGSDATTSAVTDQQLQINAAGIYGTPTVFVNGQPIVGPKPARVYTRFLK